MKKIFYSLLMVAAVIWGFWYGGRAYDRNHFTGSELPLYTDMQAACAQGVEAKLDKVLELQNGTLTLAQGGGPGADWSAFVTAFGESKLVERTGQSRNIHTAERYFLTLSGTDSVGRSWTGKMKLYADEVMDIQISLTAVGQEEPTLYEARYQLNKTTMPQILETLMEPVPGAPEGPFTLTKKGEVTDGSGSLVQLAPKAD